MQDNQITSSNKPTIRKFFKVLLNDWWSGMSGALSIPFTFLGIMRSGWQKDLFYVLAIIALGFTAWRLWSKERGRVLLLENLGQPNKTNYDKFIGFLNQKAEQELLEDSNFPSVKDTLIEWHKRIQNGIKLFFGAQEIDRMVVVINQDISSRIEYLKFYAVDNEQLKRTVNKCQDLVREMRQKINPTMMSKDFNPLDLDK